MTRPSPIIDVREDAYEAIASETARRLPLEAGGILLGYREDRNVVITHALAIDSREATTDRYVRDDVRANVRLEEFLAPRAADDPIGYVGEWHSHPVPSTPSSIDVAAIRAAAKVGDGPLALLVYFPGDAGRMSGLIAHRRHRLGRAMSRLATVSVPPSRFEPLGPLPDGAVRGDGPVFISYRQWDGTPQAESLENLLRAAGLVVWRDRTDLRPGTTTERLEQALTAGLSAGVLVVTPDIVDSVIVRERELPRLLQLDGDPAFSLCIANAVARGIGSKCDYDAPDRLLRLAPARTLADKKQANMLDQSGEIEIVRDLLMHRIEQRKPAIHEAGRDFTIRVQSRPAPYASDADQSDLHIRIKSPNDGRLPSPKGLEYLRRALPLTSDAVYAAGSPRVRISGGAHLSIGLALGAALPETKFGNVAVVDNKGNAWKSTTPDDDPRTTRLKVDDVHPALVSNAHAPDRVAIFVTLTADPDRTAFDRLVNDDAQGFSAVEILSVEGSEHIDPREAARLSMELGQRIRRLSASRGRSEVHLAFHGPFTVAVLLGRHLNTLRTVVYEWDCDTSSGPSYKPVIALVPGTTAGPITDVFG